MRSTERHPRPGHLCLWTAIALSASVLVAAPAIADAATKSHAATTKTTRTEHDLLGDKEVPADAYYGVQTARALENFQLSGVTIDHYPGFVEAWAIVKLAAARANTDVGAMKPERLAMIEKACKAVMDGKYHDQFLVDWYQGGAGTSTNMNANEVIGHLAQAHPNDHVNRGQSSNDVIPTAIHVAAAMVATEELLPALEGLKASLDAKADELLEKRRWMLAQNEAGR